MHKDMQRCAREHRGAQVNAKMHRRGLRANATCEDDMSESPIVALGDMK